MHFSKVDMPQNSLFRFLLVTVIKSLRIKTVENLIKCVFSLKIRRAFLPVASPILS